MQVITSSNNKKCLYFLEHRSKSPHNSHSPPVEKPKPKERKAETPRKLSGSSAPEHRAHRSMIAELKAKFQAFNDEEVDEGMVF
jgi:hypothetical protein